MTDEQKAVVFLDFIDLLKSSGSWCGETHVQKGTYFLQEVTKVPLGFEFVFYKHGPYSFDLNDEITSLMADLMLAVKAREPYGPTILLGENSQSFLDRYPRTRKQFRHQAEFIAARLGKKNVKELERLATALFVTRNELPRASLEARASRVNELKPHFTLDEARAAVAEVDGLIANAEPFVRSSN